MPPTSTGQRRDRDRRARWFTTSSIMQSPTTARSTRSNSPPRAALRQPQPPSSNPHRWTRKTLLYGDQIPVAGELRGSDGMVYLSSARCAGRPGLVVKFDPVGGFRSRHGYRLPARPVKGSTFEDIAPSSHREAIESRPGGEWSGILGYELRSRGNITRGPVASMIARRCEPPGRPPGRRPDACYDDEARCMKPTSMRGGRRGPTGLTDGTLTQTGP